VTPSCQPADTPHRPEPARVLTVWQPYAWAIVTGRKTTEDRTWKPSYRGRLWIHAGTETDLQAPAGLWPAGRALLLRSAILGHVTLTGVQGDPGDWHWILTDPLQLAEPLTGVRGFAGIWLYDLPPGLR
jgi:ASCH domain